MASYFGRRGDPYFTGVRQSFKEPCRLTCGSFAGILDLFTMQADAGDSGFLSRTGVREISNLTGTRAYPRSSFFKKFKGGGMADRQSFILTKIAPVGIHAPFFQQHVSALEAARCRT